MKSHANTKTVDIPARTEEILEEMSRQRGESFQTLIANAVDCYQRKIIFEKANAAYAAATAENSESDRAERQEFELWESSTIADGLSDEHLKPEGGSAGSNL